VDSSFATQAEIDAVLKIQNQKRDVEYLQVPLPKLTEAPADQEVAAYYQQHQDSFQTEEQASVEYVELSLDKLAT